MSRHDDVAIRRFLQIVIILTSIHLVQYYSNERQMSTDTKQEQTDLPVLFVTHGAYEIHRSDKSQSFIMIFFSSFKRSNDVFGCTSITCSW